jgi:hypothetical protein
MCVIVMQFERWFHPAAVWTKNVTLQLEKKTGAVVLLTIVSVACAFSVERNRVRSSTSEVETPRSAGSSPTHAIPPKTHSATIESVLTLSIHRTILLSCDRVRLL